MVKSIEGQPVKSRDKIGADSFATCFHVLDEVILPWCRMRRSWSLLGRWQFKQFV
jgi:hypothetical protein